MPLLDSESAPSSALVNPRKLRTLRTAWNLRQRVEEQQFEHRDRIQGQQHDHGLLPVGRLFAGIITEVKPIREGSGDLLVTLIDERLDLPRASRRASY